MIRIVITKRPIDPIEICTYERENIPQEYREAVALIDAADSGYVYGVGFSLFEGSGGEGNIYYLHIAATHLLNEDAGGGVLV